MNNREALAKPIRRAASRQAADGDISASRREFLARIPGAAAVTLASTAVPFGSSAETGGGHGDGSDGTDRVRDSYDVREDAARDETKVPVPKQVPNGDEQTYQYQNYIGNYSKGLPHNAIGEVDPAAYRSLLSALHQGTAKALEKNITLGGTTKLVNPLAGLAFDLEGTNSHQLAIRPFPPLASRALADQAVELYWMALCRDVNFTAYGSTKRTRDAAKELSSLSGFTGPRSGGLVTPQTLFRGFTAGDVIGPYVSQFLLQPFSYGPYAMDGRMSVAKADTDYLTDAVAWWNNQNGTSFQGQDPDPTPRAMRNGRDLATYVHTDPNAGLFMSFYNAGIFLFENGAPYNPGNPYLAYDKQSPFGTFGVPFFLGLIGEAAVRAFKAAWYAKWFVHRALRPDQYGGLVHWKKKNQKDYPVHADILKSPAVAGVFTKYGTYFLPQAYPEAGPQHPSYPSGHATMAGACATVLKAAFDGNTAFASLTNNTILVANDDGSLTTYGGSDASQITINGEINKLASNISQGRDLAGIHWRSDAEEGMRLGEKVAISILRDQRNDSVGENFKGFAITTFDGKPIVV